MYWYVCSSAKSSVSVVCEEHFTLLSVLCVPLGACGRMDIGREALYLVFIVAAHE